MSAGGVVGLLVFLLRGRWPCRRFPPARLQVIFRKGWRRRRFQARGAPSPFPERGIGGCMAFFHKNLCQSGPDGAEAVGPLVEAPGQAAGKSGWGCPGGMAGGRAPAGNPESELRGLVMIGQLGEGRVPVSFVLPGDLEDTVVSILWQAV